MKLDFKFIPSYAQYNMSQIVYEKYDKSQSTVFGHTLNLSN